MNNGKPVLALFTVVAAIAFMLFSALTLQTFLLPTLLFHAFLLFPAFHFHALLLLPALLLDALLLLFPAFPFNLHLLLFPALSFLAVSALDGCGSARLAAFAIKCDFPFPCAFLALPGKVAVLTLCFIGLETADGD